MKARPSAAGGSFPVRAVVDESSDEDYGSKSHKRKNVASGARSREDSYAGGYSAREAARKPVNYDEANVDYGLEESDFDEEDDEGGYKARGASRFGA